ncbi:MAG: hypothetical protein RI922_1898 [Bacteroidota bacterium]
MLRFFVLSSDNQHICKMIYYSSMSSKLYQFFGCLFFVLLSIISFGQEMQTIPVNWLNATSYSYFGETVNAPTIEGQTLNNGKPNFYWTKKLKSENYKVELVDYNSVQAPKEDLIFLNRFGIEINGEISFEGKVSGAGNEYFAAVQFVPYIKKNGVIHRITTVNVAIEQQPAKLKEKDFVANSVLAEGSGTWVKISVKQDAIYKIDKAFLEACGINTTELDPNAINIFGNGEGRLPELNSVYRTDDLAKNAIKIIGDSDGSFDDGDYILFYGWGPNRWKANGLVDYDQDKNIYSDESFYFININSNDVPLRISSISNSSAAVNNAVSSYSFHTIHENDLTNLVSAGQRWYGELFDTELEQVFNFTIPNLVTSQPVTFKTAIATNCESSGGTLQRYSVNGNTLFSATLNSVSSDWVRSTAIMSLTNPSNSIPFKIQITRNSPNTVVYLDRILLNARRSLVFYGQQFNFSDLSSVGVGNVSEFQLSNFPSTGFVWDVTDRHAPKLIQGTISGSLYSFIQDTDSLREFVASNGSVFLTPEYKESVSYQNLHGLQQADYLIVTHKNFTSYAERLADLHRDQGMTVHVVTSQQVFNEYSSGMLDPTAIRMFAKMFYDRGASNPTSRPKYLLLFGDGTFDPKNRVANNNNYIPTYQVLTSENHIDAMVTDDYYGMLNDNESIMAVDMLDIGVGRLLVSDAQMAKQQVDKIEHYMHNGSNLFSTTTTNCNCDSSSSSKTFGDWRLNYVQITDDEESGYFVVQDCEPQYKYTKINHTEMNCEKLYSDAFTQVSMAGGERYPDVNEAITNQVEKGALLINYVGHGGEVGFAEERIVTVPQIQSWKNIDKLNLFVSATCEFTKYDDPARVSAGEWASLNPYGSSIALMTTTRSVWFGVNTITGKKFFENVFNRDANNEPLAFGDIMRLTKNASGASDNKRSFTLIGDPALKIALPRLKVVTDSINGLSSTVEIDTIKALSKMTIKGHVEDQNGLALTNFNGILSPSIFDKPKMQQTLGQNNDSPIIPFELQRNVVYKGKVSIVNGNFEFNFIVPKDINFAYGPGKISYYAENGSTDAGGFDTLFITGGIDPTGIIDVTGPEIELHLNDESFVSGGITDETPILIASIFDENGINTVGNGIGHDLVAIVDENTAEPIVLNEYYTADLDSYQSGKVNYTMPTLEKGKHKLTLKVWDVNNNSSQTTIEFIVQSKEEIALDHVLNYPNPFTTKTEFYFEHNQVCSELETQIQIYTVSGKLVKTINQLVNTQGFRSEGIPWDGKDEFGDQLAKGVYIYKIKVKSIDGNIAEKTEKLVLLK